MMKALTFAAAVGLAGLTLTAPADAQVVKHTTVTERPNGTVVKRTVVHPVYRRPYYHAYHRPYYRPYYRPAWHPGWHAGYSRHCVTHWSYGRRVTRCW